MSNKPSNSLESQRNRILEYLRASPLTTQTARTELDIMHPAGRVQELRKDGHNIHTHWEMVEREQVKHRIAKYVLLSGDANG